MSQWATNVPPAVKVRLQVQDAVVGVAGHPVAWSVQWTLCSRKPVPLVTVTVSPTWTVTPLGLKLVSFAAAVTEAPAALAGPAIAKPRRAATAAPATIAPNRSLPALISRPYDRR